MGYVCNCVKNYVLVVLGFHSVYSSNAEATGHRCEEAYKPCETIREQDTDLINLYFVHL